MILDPTKLYFANISTNHGDMVAQLFADEAPRTVNNFVFLAREGFYEDGSFHRVIKDFMIQGGCPEGTGRGGPGYRFQDEQVTRPYVKGTLAMANAGPNTNGSQFFIVHGANVGLPPNYTIFGMLVEGDETLDTLANSACGFRRRRRTLRPYRAAANPQHRNPRTGSNPRRLIPSMDNG